MTAAAARAVPPTAVRPPLRVLPRPVLRVADVSLFYGDRSGGIRTYLDEKVAWARATGACEHHLIVPGTRERHHADGPTMRHELPSLRMATSNGYRLPVGARRLRDTLRLIRPDVVLLHDPFWRPREVARVVQVAGGRIVMVHHGSADLDAGAFRGPHRVYRRAFQSWLRHAYAPADAIMSACDAAHDVGRTAELPLRFGLHPAFRPRAAGRRGDHVLYAGRLGREKGLFTLLEAAARSREPWPLELVGAGPARDAVAAEVRRLGLEERVTFGPYVEDRAALAEAYAAARCVVMPGPWETFGLVAFEAAASGASVVACRTAPSAQLLGPLARTFRPEDPVDLERAIAAARMDAPDLTAATAFAREHGWERALARELSDLEGLTVEERCS